LQTVIYSTRATTAKKIPQGNDFELFFGFGDWRVFWGLGLKAKQEDDKAMKKVLRSEIK
jgi:hypothetical protein